MINHTELGKENWFSRIPSSPAHGGGANHSFGVNLRMRKINVIFIARVFSSRVVYIYSPCDDKEAKTDENVGTCGIRKETKRE